MTEPDKPATGPSGKPRPFFIFGCPRSGTSLLSRMLGYHENIVVPQESLLFKMFSSFQSHYGDLSQRENQETLLRDMLATRVIGSWEPRPRLKDAMAMLSRPGFGGAVEALVLATAMDRNIALWGEKSPGHVFYWRQIKDSFPHAKVVHIIRDGRDAATSLLNARMGPKTYYAAARLWKTYLEQMRRVKSDCAARDFVEVRYEDLLDDPESTLRRICDTLEIDFSARMLRFHENKTHYLTDAVNSSNLHHSLLAQNKNKWRQAMNERQLAEFDAVASDCLEENGYAATSGIRPISQLRLNFVRWISSPVRRFKARAIDFQGQREFLNLQTIKARRRIICLLAHAVPRWSDTSHPTPSLR